MEDLGSEIRQLGCFIEADDLDATGVSAEVGIGRHHPVHVGPDLDAFGVEPGTYNGC